VLLREDVPNQKRLAAYVIGANGVPPTSAELLFFLKTKLPDYMIPEAFVILNEFPTTPNGKVNRNALPAPESIADAAKAKSALPRTPVEKQLASIWRDVMRREQVGREDDFFAIGGHSLAAMMVLSRARKMFNANLTIRDLFAAPTIAGLAAMIAAQNGDSTNGSSSLLETIAPTQNL
jgi:aryl carrier-like protein